ncbi:hypothetical protein [Cellulomonas sp. NPDC058312]|uniref:hypothetical protein n=1 Tax=Cellulomonas sp. NPDC058312 TaxID=3346441 RepID=UPI0036EC2425
MAEGGIDVDGGPADGATSPRSGVSGRAELGELVVLGGNEGDAAPFSCRPFSASVSGAPGKGGVGVVVVVVVELTLGAGVGVVVGCAVALPPPAASKTDASETTIKLFAGELRFGHDKFRYFVVLAI